MTTGKLDCSTKCPLDGTRKVSIRGLLEDRRPVRGDSPTRQDGTSTEGVQNKEGSEEDRS
jgi:hypothetical protein